MKYVVDMALCAGHGLCADAAPDVYTLDDEGFNAESGHTVAVPSHLEGAAREGAMLCPESAIQILD